MHEDESDVRDHLESGTKLLIRKPLTQVDQLSEKSKLKDDLFCQISPIKMIHIITVITVFTTLLSNLTSS